MDHFTQILSCFSLQSIARHISLNILLQMILTALPRDAAENSLSGGFQACVGFTGYQLHSSLSLLTRVFRKLR